jgi:hypothetical protein
MQCQSALKLLNELRIFRLKQVLGETCVAPERFKSFTQFDKLAGNVKLIISPFTDPFLCVTVSSKVKVNVKFSKCLIKYHAMKMYPFIN